MKIRTWGVITISACGLLAAGLASAYIFPNAVNDFKYYSNSSMTTQVGGERIADCPGYPSYQSWGQKTSYKIHDVWSCPAEP